MMNNKLIKILSIAFLILAILMVSSTLFPLVAQVVPPPPSDNPCPGGEPCDPDVPITGIEWLLVAGGLFGARKVYNKLRNK